MNKTAIKNFAVRARQQLLEAAEESARRLEIRKAGEKATAAPSALTPEEQIHRRQLLRQIRSKGFDTVMEEVAYLWFSRFVALRYLEVNGLLTEGAKRLLERGAEEALEAHLLIGLCNDLHSCLPHMFQRIPDWAAALLPDTHSIWGQLTDQIPEADFRDHVQIIGWMYQHYISHLKNDTFAQRKKNVKIPKERIPAATQLFTPEWIVRYLVENSVGRLYIRYQLDRCKETVSEDRRISLEQEIAKEMGWHYYLPEAKQSSGVSIPMGMEDTASFDVARLKVMDPCMGCGHILVYAFDVLMQIYRACGWSESAAARSILENNLYGLDIDPRAGQLSYFALMMKAVKYDPQLLNQEVYPHIFAIGDSGFLTDEYIDCVVGKDGSLRNDLMLLRSVFRNAEEYGSLLEAPKMDYSALCRKIGSGAQQLLSLVRQAQLLSQSYDAVVTNPPYMGAGSMSDALSGFVRKHYPDSKSDLFAVFMERCLQLTATGGYLAMITQHAWMFLRSFETLRKKLLTYDTVNMAHLGPRAFEEIPGSVVQTASFVLRKTHIEGYRGTYCRLTAPINQRSKEKLFLSGGSRYTAAQQDFAKIPGSPVAYWLSDVWLELFASNQTVGTIARPKQGIATANNSHYLRLWHECKAEDIFFDCTCRQQSAQDPRKWYPYNKGGEGRKWYGNQEYVINWCRDGSELRADPKAVIRNPDYFFRECVSWSLVSPGIPAFRFKPEGQLFDVAGMCCFSETDLPYLLALFNTKVVFEILKVLAPTINYQCGDIANIPFKLHPDRKEEAEQLTKSNVELSKQDWDSFEVSWEFQKHPLI